MDEADPMRVLLDLANRMRDAKNHHSITKHRDDGVSITATVAGDRLEIDVLDDDEIVVEVFKPQGNCRGKEAPDELFARHSN